MWQTERLCNLIRLFKADARDRPAQRIGVLLDDVNRGRAVFLINLYRRSRSHEFGAEGHNAAHAELALEILRNLGGLGHRNAGQLGQPFRVVLYDIKSVHPEFIYNAAGCDRANSLHRAGRKIFKYGRFRGGQAFFKVLHFELASKGGVYFPAAHGFEGFPLTNIRHNTGQGNQFGFGYGKVEHAVAVLFVLINDMLDNPLDGDQLFFFVFTHDGFVFR